MSVQGFFFPPLHKLASGQPYLIPSSVPGEGEKHDACINHSCVKHSFPLPSEQIAKTFTATAGSEGKGEGCFTQALLFLKNLSVLPPLQECHCLSPLIRHKCGWKHFVQWKNLTQLSKSNWIIISVIAFIIVTMKHNLLVNLWQFFLTRNNCVL